MATGLLPPHITICNYQALSVPVMWRLYTTQNNSHTSNELKTFENISQRLFGIQHITKGAENLNTNDKWKDKLLSIRGDLDRTITFTLLRNIPDMSAETIFDEIGPPMEDTIRYCSNSGRKCKNIKQLQYGNFPKCFNYDTAQNNTGKTLGNVGLTNGLTMVFNTGVQMSSVAVKRYFLNNMKKSWQTLQNPNFQNNFYPFAANGIRLMINSPGVKPDMDQQGINVIPGHSTLIATKGTEITRLSSPYTDCTFTDNEMKMLQENVARSLEYKPSGSKQDAGIYTYTQQQCRTACLQRKIFGECRCLDSFLDLPFDNINGSVLCGNLAKADMDIFLNPESYNKSQCFLNLTYLISDRCKFLHKMVEDLVCVKQVKERHDEETMSGKSKCQCPPACHSYQYDITISQALWPAAGVETQEVYYNLLEKDNFKQERSYVFEPNQTEETDEFCPYSLQKGVSAENKNGSTKFQGLRLVTFNPTLFELMTRM